MHKKIVLVLLVFISLFSSIYSINITGCQGLIAGNSYLLTQDVWNDTGVCFSVVGNNVVLDCGGHIVDGSRDGDIISCASRTNVTIKNCDLREGNNGITFNSGGSLYIDNVNITDMDNTGLDILFESDNHNINNMVIQNVGEHGIHLDAGSGTKSDNSVFTNITINNALGNGITWEVGTNNTFNNFLVTNTDRGISAGTVSNSFINNFTIINSTLDYGVYISQTGNNIIWNDLSIINSALMGFRCDYISSNTLCDNSVFNNLLIDGTSTSSGMSIERADNITINSFEIKNIGNDVNDNGLVLGGNNGAGHNIQNGIINNVSNSCIKFEDTGANSFINNITISNCGQFGFACDDIVDNGVCDFSIFQNLNISASANHGLFLQESNNLQLINITSRFNTGSGIYFTNSNNNILSFSNLLNNSGYSVTLINSNNITIYGSQISNISSDNWALDYFFNNTVNNVSLGNYWVDFNNCTSSTFFELGGYEYEICLDNDYVIDQVNNVIDYAPIVAITLIVQGNQTGNQTPIIINNYEELENIIVGSLGVVDLIIYLVNKLLTEKVIVISIMMPIILLLIFIFKTLLGEYIEKTINKALKK